MFSNKFKHELNIISTIFGVFIVTKKGGINHNLKISILHKKFYQFYYIYSAVILYFMSISLKIEITFT
jgi:hypothetical protein